MTKFLSIILALFCTVLPGSLACLAAEEAPPDPAPAAAAKPVDDAEIGRLVEGLKGWDRDQVQANSDALAKIGEPAVPALIGALKNEDPGVRSSAARVLGEIEAKEAAVPLGELFDDPKYWVTRNAVYSLGNIGGPESVELLKKALTHYRPQVQEAALWGLDELQEQSAIPEISDLMVSAPDQYVRWRAMTVLRSLKEGEEITFLIKTLNDPEADATKRRNAAVMLGSLEV
ncbi:MAG: HEAT repeat domain-containing protein, partial [Candidatus Erginobacter occultus]|nr:HEAT repeat domain-containing protein [Candidatus Erginobacter occultus]